MREQRNIIFNFIAFFGNCDIICGRCDAFLYEAVTLLIRRNKAWTVGEFRR